MDAGQLIQLAPTIMSFLGPLGTAAGVGLEFLGDKLGLTDKTKDNIKDAIQGMTADQQIQLKKLDIEFQEFVLANNIQIQLAQIGTNTEEAKSTNWFVAGWRPYVGWICGTALAYVAIVEPIARFIAKVGFNYAGAFPVIDTTLTMQVLLGMLGMTAARSFDKKNGVEEHK